MSSDEKEKIIKLNSDLGIETEFINNRDILGYSLGNTIYINEAINQDYFKTNKHELLHFYTDTDEFKELKTYLLEKYKNEIDGYRDEYELRYFGLYNEDELREGLLDDEIVIDLMVDNFSITIDNGLKIGDSLIASQKKHLEYKRYLNLTLNNNLQAMSLSNWEKIFVLNFYDGKNHKMPKQNKVETIREDIQKELTRLYELALNKDNFYLNMDSPDVIKEYKNKIAILKRKGEDTKKLIDNRDVVLNEIAKKHGEQLYTEYKHLVDFIKKTDYPDSFKTVMLRETLLKVYKKEIINSKVRTIIDKRDIHNTISNHMLFNQTILDVIYNNVEDYSNFANLYFAAIEIFNKKSIVESILNLTAVDTYGMGRWIKFNGKESDSDKYLENAKKLAAAVQKTQWCTKSLASVQLSEGDFYLFIDWENHPHIAIKMIGDSIDEVRGIYNGKAQELEPNYRKVALSFLENNQNIKNGSEWLDKEEWNFRLINYKEKIETGTLKKDDVPYLFDDIFKIDFQEHGIENANLVALKNSLPKARKTFAEYYNCQEEEIFCGNIDFKKTNYSTVPYKLILGDVTFSKSNITSLGGLEYILGNANFCNSQVRDTGDLIGISQTAYFDKTPVTSLKNIRNIGGSAYFRNCSLVDFGNLQNIARGTYIKNIPAISLGNIENIGWDLYIEAASITDLGNVQRIGEKFSTDSPYLYMIYNREFEKGKRISIDKKTKNR